MRTLSQASPTFAYSFRFAARSLIVAINSDSSLAGLKGPKRPLVPQTDRTQLLAALSCIDYVVVFNELTPYELLSKFHYRFLLRPSKVYS